MKARDAGTRDPGPGSREGQGDRQRAHSDQLAQASPAISASGSQEQQRSHPDHVADPGSSDSRIPNPDSQLHLYYGGTFDPIHLGHLAIACAARDELGACVRLVPAADPPHRPAPGATATQRAQMLKLALANYPGLQLDSRELQRAAHCDAPSYTVDTLRGLRAELGPAAPIAWLLGADAFAGLHHWHQWEALFGLAHFVVAARPGTPLTLADAPQLATAVQGRWVAGADELLGAPAVRLYLLHQPLRGESASAVRSRIATGAQWQSLVPPPVAGMIQREGLYRSVRPAT
ncbi:nicotinate-nucleotide adenylyltransferase [Xanthomonas citri pv. malvacearum]|uniref:nicotinate-nucleotide adenylyltransferase n=1 Tax=Xanthomonas citri TaxID=346 RepID=UPI0022AF460D|nr:nicotinate-nucleotide adenylyltransferase [Xanthomonas citri]WAW92603.1 nicotinate-nucleotide adenylyltransferase [Xanthomonas citri pv. malvacearum]